MSLISKRLKFWERRNANCKQQRRCACDDPYEEPPFCEQCPAYRSQDSSPIRSKSMSMYDKPPYGNAKRRTSCDCARNAPPSYSDDNTQDPCPCPPVLQTNSCPCSPIICTAKIDKRRRCSNASRADSCACTNPDRRNRNTGESTCECSKNRQTTCREHKELDTPDVCPCSPPIQNNCCKCPPLICTAPRKVPCLAKCNKESATEATQCERPCPMSVTVPLDLNICPRYVQPVCPCEVLPILPEPIEALVQGPYDQLYESPPVQSPLSSMRQSTMDQSSMMKPTMSNIGTEPILDDVPSLRYSYAGVPSRQNALGNMDAETSMSTSYARPSTVLNASSIRQSMANRSSMMRHTMSGIGNEPMYAGVPSMQNTLANMDVEMSMSTPSVMMNRSGVRQSMANRSSMMSPTLSNGTRSFIGDAGSLRYPYAGVPSRQNTSRSMDVETSMSRPSVRPSAMLSRSGIRQSMANRSSMMRTMSSVGTDAYPRSYTGIEREEIVNDIPMSNWSNVGVPSRHWENVDMDTNMSTSTGMPSAMLYTSAVSPSMANKSSYMKPTVSNIGTETILNDAGEPSRRNILSNMDVETSMSSAGVRNVSQNRMSRASQMTANRASQVRQSTTSHSAMIPSFSQHALRATGQSTPELRLSSIIQPLPDSPTESLISASQASASQTRSRSMQAARSVEKSKSRVHMNESLPSLGSLPPERQSNKLALLQGEDSRAQVPPVEGTPVSRMSIGGKRMSLFPVPSPALITRLSMMVPPSVLSGENTDERVSGESASGEDDSAPRASAASARVPPVRQPSIAISKLLSNEPTYETPPVFTRQSVSSPKSKSRLSMKRSQSITSEPTLSQMDRRARQSILKPPGSRRSPSLLPSVPETESGLLAQKSSSRISRTSSKPLPFAEAQMISGEVLQEPEEPSIYAQIMTEESDPEENSGSRLLVPPRLPDPRFGRSFIDSAVKESLFKSRSSSGQDLDSLYQPIPSTQSLQSPNYDNDRNKYAEMEMNGQSNSEMYEQENQEIIENAEAEEFGSPELYYGESPLNYEMDYEDGNYEMADTSANQYSTVPEEYDLMSNTEEDSPENNDYQMTDYYEPNYYDDLFQHQNSVTESPIGQCADYIACDPVSNYKVDCNCGCYECLDGQSSFWDFMTAMLLPRHQYALSLISVSILVIILCLGTYWTPVIHKFIFPRKCIRWHH